MTVNEADEGNNDLELQYLVEQTVKACRELPFVPSDLELIDLRISREQIQVNLNQSFKSIFSEKMGVQERLQAELILDALFMTVFENSRAQRVEVLLEGDEWEPPIGYPSLGRFHHRPYFINPEQ